MQVFSQIIRYVTYQFFFDLMKIFFIFFILLLFAVTFDEVNLIRKIENITFIIFLKLIFFKIPGILFNFSPFIFLFAGMLSHLKLKNRNEVIAMRIIGISNLKLISVSAIVAFFLGIIIILILNPLTSFTSKEYESIKSNYFEQKNFFFINDTGLWILVERENNKQIIRIENLDFNKSIIKNITILNLSKDFEFQSRIDSKEGIFNNNSIKLLNSTTYDNKKNKKKTQDHQLDLNFSLKEIQNTFKNSSSISIYEIQDQIQNIQKLGYSTDHLTVEYQKLISLPIYLFAMVLFSGLMIVNIGTNMGYIFYIVTGVIISVLLYFLSDLSITMGKTEKIDLQLSVWFPIFFIMLVNFIGLIQVNAK